MLSHRYVFYYFIKRDKLGIGRMTYSGEENKVVSGPGFDGCLDLQVKGRIAYEREDDWLKVGQPLKSGIVR